MSLDPDSLPPVLVLHNIPSTSGPLESDAGVLVQLRALTDALARLHVPHHVHGVARLEDVPPVLAASHAPVVFNLVESFHLHPHHAAFLPALCLAFGKSCTGSPTACLELTLDKARTKAVLAAARLPVPPGFLVHPGDSFSADQLPPGPWIVKPLRADASEGIHARSSVFTSPGPELDRAVRNIHTAFAQPALVETLVGSRELNVSLLQQSGDLTVLPLAEIDFSAFGPERPRVVDYAAKWDAASFEYNNTPRLIPAPIPESLADEIRSLARAAFLAVDCLDYARVDFRLTTDLRPVILEVNSNPDISPDAGFPAALAAADISFDDFIRTVLKNAASRSPRGTAALGCHSASKAKKVLPSSIDIAWTTPADRDPVLRLFHDTGFFYPSEIEVVRELIDDALAHGPEGHYQSFTAHVDGKVAGWVCFGPIACTLGTFDLYWIGVDPKLQGRSIGRFLMDFAEDLIARRGGRLVVLETAGRPLYEPTRQFYLRIGYTEAARLPDFYAPGDDKIVYMKPLSP